MKCLCTAVVMLCTAVDWCRVSYQISMVNNIYHLPSTASSLRTAERCFPYRSVVLGRPVAVKHRFPQPFRELRCANSRPPILIIRAVVTRSGAILTSSRAHNAWRRQRQEIPLGIDVVSKTLFLPADHVTYKARI